MSFPSVPGWDGIHPAIVQFPIALLIVAPLFLLIALFARQSWRVWAGASLILMTLGALAVWLAVATGHASGQLVDKTPALERAIRSHEALGLWTRTVFTALTAVFAALLWFSVAMKQRLPGALRIGMHALFLVVYLGLSLAILDTASRGGWLVHEMGVRAMVATPSTPAAADAGEAERPVARNTP